jgi:MOSC domain-containing protein YiiM
MPTLLSVNIAAPRPGPGGVTGIDKRPSDGPVRVSAPGPRGNGLTGLAGDRVFAVDVHGGDDQAAYAFAREDLDRWQAELGRPLTNGVFGENLTTSGVDVTAALIGERWRVGDGVLLEVTRPRIPCGTFAAWMGEDDWVKRFIERAVPGAYLRVIVDGEIRAGDAVTVVSRPDHDLTIGVTFRALTLEPDLLPRLVGIEALPMTLREKVARRVASPD